MSEGGKLLHSVNDACRLLSIGRTCIYSEIRQGKLQTVRVGKRTLIAQAALDDYVGSLVKEAAEERRA